MPFLAFQEEELSSSRFYFCYLDNVPKMSWRVFSWIVIKDELQLPQEKNAVAGDFFRMGSVFRRLLFTMSKKGGLEEKKIVLRQK